MDPLFNRLVVELPVRHGKSEYCSHNLIAWHLMVHPEQSVILGTGDRRLGDIFSSKVRNTLLDAGPSLTGTHLTSSHPRLDHFETTEGGHFHLRTPGSSTAGIGGHLLVGDDLVASQEEAASPTQRDKLHRWFLSEFLTRGTPDAKCVLVMSRRHPDDLTGRLIESNPTLPPHLQWHRLTMQAIDQQGKALWEEMRPLSFLEGVRQEFEESGTSYLWQCLYQQNPTADNLSLEWPDSYLQGILYDELPPSLKPFCHILALDPSKGKNSATGDYSAFMDMLLTQDGTLWVEPLLKRMPTDQVEDTAVELLERTRYDAFAHEINGFQELLADNIVRKCERKGVHCPLRKLESTTDKVVRIRMDLTPLLARKRIRVFAHTRYSNLLIQQLREFPTGLHDDGPDSLSMGTRVINQLLQGNRQAPKVRYSA